MDRKQKQDLVTDLHGRLERAYATFLLDYKGLDVDAMNRLRRELKDVGTEFHVVKNRLLRLASKQTDTATLEDQMRGPSAIAVTYENVVAPAKIITNFLKDFDRLSVKTGQISGSAVNEESVKRLAELPGREQLLAQTLAAMEAVPGSLVRVLNGVLVKFVMVLKAIEEEKSQPA